MRFTICSLVTLVWALVPTSARGQLVVTLAMTSLPNSQAPAGPNWTYQAGPTTPMPLAPTFSVGVNGASEPTLFINTMPDDLVSPDSAGFILPGILDPAQHLFSVSIRARVLVDETAGNHFGLATYVAYGGKFVGLGFGPTQIQASDLAGVRTLATGLNNTNYRNYLLTGNILTGAWELRQDSVPVGSGMMLSSGLSQLFLGDGSGASNAQSEVTHYSFSSVPEPGSAALVAMAAAIAIGRRCPRKFSSTLRRRP